MVSRPARETGLPPLVPAVVMVPVAQLGIMRSLPEAIPGSSRVLVPADILDSSQVLVPARTQGSPNADSNPVRGSSRVLVLADILASLTPASSRRRVRPTAQGTIGLVQPSPAQVATVTQLHQPGQAVQHILRVPVRDRGCLVQAIPVLVALRGNRLRSPAPACLLALPLAWHYCLPY